MGLDGELGVLKSSWCRFVSGEWWMVGGGGGQWAVGDGLSVEYGFRGYEELYPEDGCCRGRRGEEG